MGQWWRDGVVYQVYPRSFVDSDGDGVGDLVGITAHLDYVAKLGVQAVWITPFQRSPQVDHGYDVSDYRDVDPLFGDLAAFDEMLRVAHAHRLRVIIDLVPNHCSSSHPLFRAALAAGPGSRERARFHFAPGRGPDGAVPPNNWISMFGGPAWTRISEPDGLPGQWYLHLYAPEQPDWNWRDPRTATFFDDVVRFWFDRGVDGLRIDVAHGLFKAEGLPDFEATATVQPMRLRSNPLACDREEVHEVYRRWRAMADAYSPPRALIGEVNLVPARVVRYTRPDELHQAFAFAFLTAPWDARAWQSIMRELLDCRIRGGAPITWVVENHDVVRAPTRYGGGARGTARARAALLAVLGLPGAAYLYQGQELGLPEVDVPPQARQDPAWSRCGVSRDGCRVPLPWRRDSNGAHGFSAEPARSPWLPVPADWGRYSVQAQHADPASTLHVCRAALALRRRLHAQGVLSADDAVDVDITTTERLVVRRGEAITLVLAMGTTPVHLPPGQLLMASSPVTRDGRLRPDTTAWLRC
ncbi:MAG: glycoside hydrolase family 13 protein [Actinomycetota bacterium]|nr:glycoside hydrolase family 13 protein [Actinomycetota bacterium]